MPELPREKQREELGMKVNQFQISDKMERDKENLPEWVWDDIIRLGLFVAKILSLCNNRIYKNLYWLSQKPVKELIAYLR